MLIGIDFHTFLRMVKDSKYPYRDLGNKFTWEGYRALYSFIEAVNPNYKLDVVRLCHDYHEYTIKEAREAHKVPEDMTDREALEYLRDNYVVISERPLIMQDKWAMEPFIKEEKAQKSFFFTRFFN